MNTQTTDTRPVMPWATCDHTGGTYLRLDLIPEAHKRGECCPHGYQKESAEWYIWRNRLTETCEANSLGAMVAFEQLALRSAKEKRCAECGEPGTVAQGATTYNHVPYWFCAECASYWAATA